MYVPLQDDVPHNQCMIHFTAYPCFVDGMLSDQHSEIKPLLEHSPFPRWMGAITIKWTNDDKGLEDYNIFFGHFHFFI